jgi:hypothetical protein
MSSSTDDPCCPAGQASQAVVVENGFKVGFAMNVPGEQHPKRAVLDPRLLNAPNHPDIDSHAPPQSVREKPLFVNTLKNKGGKKV